MSVPVLDNFSYGGRKPNFERDEFATIALMAAYPESKLPTTFIATVDEDGEIYVYNKNNTVDPATGKWRLWSPGGGDPIQVVSLPNPVASLEGKIFQFVGETGTYTKGYFYICTSSGETQVVDITTLTDLKDTINKSENNIEVNNGTETVETKVFTFDSVNYYVIEDIVYSTSNTSGDISVDTVLSTDEEVVALNLTKEIVVYTYSWSNKLVQPTAGGDAKDIAYNNTDKPELTNVKLALDDLISKVYYVEPKVNSFTMAPSTTDYEIGQSVSDIVFNWAYNKDVVSQTLTDCTLADVTVRTATASGPYTATKTFTLSASDGEKTATATKTISFRHKVYWGSAASASTYDSAFILALSGKKFATNYKGTYSMNVAEGEYGFLAYPSSWGMVSTWWIGGFEVETFDCGTVEFTNASGNTTTFRIVRTTQPGLGEIAPEVK